MGRLQRQSAVPNLQSRRTTSRGRFGDAVLAARYGARGRFIDGRAWFRLVLLGLLLSIIGTVALTSILNIRPLPAIRIGEAAIVGGMSIGLLTVKIVRAPVPWDWLASGLSLIAAGQVLEFDPVLNGPASLGLFVLFALGSAIARIWIGMTTSSPRARAWIYSSGCLSVLAILLIVGLGSARSQALLSLIFALDILLQGIATMGFSFGLKEKT